MDQNIKEKALAELQKLEEIVLLQQFQGFLPQLEHLRARLADDEFRIAVVGEFSSGKSTFINALLGRDVLQHATNETTAALTRIINVAPDDPRTQTGRVFLRSGDCVELSSLDGLKEYTTTASERFHVAEEVELVEICLPVMDGGQNIVIVDTPGLNGIADGHREQTISMVQRAHACIYLLQRRGLAESDIQFLTYLTRFQKNFIFVQNFIDDFRQSEGETVEVKLAEQAKILQEKVFAGVQGVQYRLCGVSALMELVSRDRNITRLYSDSTEDLTREERDKLARKSNFDEFRGVMAENFQADRLAQIQYGDTALTICEWLRALEDRLSRRQAQVNEVYAVSRERRSVERLERLKQKVLENRPRQEEYLRNFVISYGKQEILDKERQELRQAVDALQEEMEAHINQVKELERVKTCEAEIPALLNAGVDKLWDDCNQRCRIKFNNLSQLLMARIEEYTHIDGKDLDLKQLSLDLVENKPAAIQLTSREKALERREKELEQRRGEQDQLSRETARLEAERRRAEEEIREIERQQSAENHAYQERIRSLSSRPKAETVEIPYVAEVYRGGFGILDSIFGPKYETRYRTETDDSKGKDWDAKKAEIINAHTKSQDELKGRLKAMERRYGDAKSSQGVNQSRLESLEEQIRSEERRLARDKELLEREMKVAKEEFLAVCKQSLKAQIHDYLFGADGENNGVFAQMTNRLREQVDKSEGQLSQWAVERFNEAVEQKLADIRDAQEKESPEIKLQADKLELAGRQLAEIRERMEAWIG